MAQDVLARLEEMEAAARAGGGPERIARQHERGNQTRKQGQQRCPC